MTSIIREYAAGDAGAAADVMGETAPSLVTNARPPQTRATAGPAPQRFRALVAAPDGGIVGHARTALPTGADEPEPGTGFAFADPDIRFGARRRGAGAAHTRAAGAATRRAHRGPAAAKTHGPHPARAAGRRAAFTRNHDGNAAMTAVNRRLGYEPCANERRFLRDLTHRA